MAMEFPKELLYEENWKLMSDQLMILAEQNRRLRRLEGKVDYVIAENPMLMGVTYKPVNYYKRFDSFCLEVFNSYNNINFLLKRVTPYIPIGRRQSEDSANGKRSEIVDLIKKNKIPIEAVVESNRNAPNTIIKFLLDKP